MEQNVVLEMRDISKNFTGVRALSHVDFTLRKGEIHALMGENGAGKSTLIKVLTGVHEFESGTIHMAGNSNAIINHSPQEAQANGISTVYQEVNLCPNLTVAENLFIGREPRKMGMIDWKQMNERSGKLLESLDIHVPPTQMLDECSIAIQQMIAIARAVDMKCQVLILDEPTSSLDDDEVEKLFVLMRRLRDEGVGIIFVTHFPSSKPPFYAMNSREDPRLAYKFDLLFRGLEITSGGQRIHDYQEQLDKMHAQGLDPEDFKYYLEAHKYGLPPHGGLGIGLERLVMKLLGLSNVRQASMFPRDITRLLP